MKKMITVILCAIFVILVPFVMAKLYHNFIFGFAVPIESLNVSSITVSDNIVYISGDVFSSSLGFSGYSAELNKTRLLITPRYSIVSWLHPNRAFEIMYDTKAETIDEIFILGNGANDQKQIWPAK
ncbi:hypothetical protein [Azotosporobacter soli]|uniref:hypothetical protein n=1 Tax=Azotosporobacter soli TaxID=3055040 RepID=UPI0031FF218A